MFGMQTAAALPTPPSSLLPFPLAQSLGGFVLQDVQSVSCSLAGCSSVVGNEPASKLGGGRKSFGFGQTTSPSLHALQRPSVREVRRGARVPNSSIDLGVVNGNAATDSPSSSSGGEEAPPAINLNTRLTARLSEANAYNRYLVRQLDKEGQHLDSFTSNLEKLETELKELTEIAYEVAFNGSKPFRKINGRYLPSYVATKLDEISKLITEKSEGAKLLRFQEIPIVWLGMAEDVKIMGSFDNWTRGKHMSPETTGTITKFSTVLNLRPGRYLVKFLIDGEWQLAPGWETEGIGFKANNILVVEPEP